MPSLYRLTPASSKDDARDYAAKELPAVLRELFDYTPTQSDLAVRELVRYGQYRSPSFTLHWVADR